MARKSRETILRERLTAVSNCPFDLFRHLEGTDDSLALIERSESGDAQATLDLIDALYPSAIADSEPSDALLYLMEKAVKLGEHSVGDKVIDYALHIRRGYPLAAEAISLLQATVGITDAQRARIIPLGARMSVSFASSALDYGAMLADMAPISKADYPFEWLFVMQRAERLGGIDVSGEIRELAESIGMIYTPSMPSFSGCDCVTPLSREACEREIEILNSVLMKHESGDWRDLWLRCMYELLERCDKYDKRSIAESVIAISESRSYYKKHSLHTLAWCSYLLDFLPSGSKSFYDMSERCRQLRDICAFEGIDPHINSDEERYLLMRECVYLSTNDEREHASEEAKLGFQILHRRNRYVLECDLHGHSKRGRMHFWNATVSIEAASEHAPVPKFDKLKISETRHVIERGGAVLDLGKTVSQSIYYSEITIDEVKHPFELDLILDISYISAVKCGEGEIRVLDHSVRDGHVIMTVQIFLY